MKIGKKLKTTGNARTPVSGSGKPSIAKKPGLPGLGGKHEASKTKVRKGKEMNCSGKGY